MRLSAFNLYVENFPEPGLTLVHNTFSGGFVALDPDTLAVLRKADGGEALSDEEQQVIDPDFFDENVGILVESRQAEEKSYREVYERKRSKTELNAIVSITFACNLDCTYCCQSDVLNGKMMNAELGAQTATWLANRALEIGAAKIKLDFVGGEPLLHPDRIEQIVGDIRRITEGRVEIVFSLITNGVFLHAEMLDRLVPIGLVSAQVTLDGDESTHNVTRRSKKGVDHFQLIFDNVVAASSRIHINVNGNYQDDTVHGFVPLLAKLAKAGLPAKNRVNFSPALTALGAPSDAASGSCTYSGSQPELMLALMDEVRTAGFDPGDPKSIGPCAFHDRHHYAIDPYGNLFKCAGFLGKTEWAIGHVASGLTPRYERMVNARPQRECGSCAHRPDCAGGCVATAWIQAGRVEGVNCEKPFFDEYQDELVTRRYGIATTDSPEELFQVATPLDPEVRARLSGRGKRSGALRVLAA